MSFGTTSSTVSLLTSSRLRTLNWVPHVCFPCAERFSQSLRSREKSAMAGIALACLWGCVCEWAGRCAGCCVRRYNHGLNSFPLSLLSCDSQQIRSDLAMTRLTLLLALVVLIAPALAMPTMHRPKHHPHPHPHHPHHPPTQTQPQPQPIFVSSAPAPAAPDCRPVRAPPEIIRGGQFEGAAGVMQGDEGGARGSPASRHPAHESLCGVSFVPPLPTDLLSPHRANSPRAVNLGGWLVLEPWITPSLFAPFINASGPEVAVDEYTFCSILGPTEARRQLQAHWDSWVTRQHLEELAEAGITHLRIPVGYWMVSIEQTEPFVSGSWPYLVRALNWAQQLGLKVLIDLHGAPGSQNGFDNSGRRGPISWDTQPPANLYRTLSVLANLTGILAPYSAAQGGPVVGIELLNEPFVTVDLSFVQNYYTQGYSVVRSNSSQNPPFHVVIHDSFRLGAWGSFMQPPAFQGVYLDTHVYHVFDMGLLRMNQTQHLSYTCDIIAAQEAQASKALWLVTGEWSLATTDCATWLNGMLKGSRWDGTLDPTQPALGSCTGDAGNDASQFDPSYLAFLKQMAESQMEVYEAAGPGSAGWFFWSVRQGTPIAHCERMPACLCDPRPAFLAPLLTLVLCSPLCSPPHRNFRTESSPQWDFLQGLRLGYIPNPVSNRTFSCQEHNERYGRRRPHRLGGEGSQEEEEEEEEAESQQQKQP